MEDRSMLADYTSENKRNFYTCHVHCFRQKSMARTSE
jgi:hypothetical protein